MPDKNKLEQAPVVITYIREKKITIQEKALIALDSQNKKMAEAGNAALPYLEQEREGGKVICPFQKGRIDDFFAAVKLFKYILEKSTGRKPILLRAKVAVCVPKEATEVERNAYTEALMMAGAKSVVLSEDSLEEADKMLPDEVEIIIALEKNWEEERIEIGYEPVDISIYSSDNKLLLKQPSLVAFDKLERKVAAIGEEAEGLRVNENKRIFVYCPLKDKKIADSQHAERMFTYFIQKALEAEEGIHRPKAIVCGLPEDMTEVDKRAYHEVLTHSGVRDVELTTKRYQNILSNLKADIQLIIEMD